MPYHLFAYFALQAMKCGVRAMSAHKMDVLCPRCTLEGNSQVVSMDEILGDDPDDPSYEITLHDVLANKGESADVSAGRNLDWADLMPRLNARQQEILRLSAEGYGTSEIAKRYRVTPANVSIHKRKLGAKVRENWGDGIADEITTVPRWGRHVQTFQERRSCRFARRAGRLHTQSIGGRA